MKAFTERSPRVLGAAGLALLAVVVLAVIFLTRGVFGSGYQVAARFADASGIGKGTVVMVAGVPVGSVSSVSIAGNAVDVTMAINGGVVLPHRTAAAIQVETLLGVEDVALQPLRGWSRPLRPGAFITDTSVPTRFSQVQNAAGHLLQHTDATALNSLIQSLATITQGKQQQVAQIIKGLGALTTTVDQRSGQVSQLINAANTLSSTLASRDTQLASVIDNLNTVVDGLATHSQDLANLIDNVDAAAAQTNSLVGGDQPQLNALLANLHTTLGVVGAHQVDLAQALSYLSSAVKGFASVGYSGAGDTPNSWANIYANTVTVASLYGVLGPCGALDQALNAALGPDPLACDRQTGPLPGTTPSGLSPGPAVDGGGGAPSSSPAAGPTPGPAGTSGPGAAPLPGLTAAPDSGVAGLNQLLSPLLGGGKP